MAATRARLSASPSPSSALLIDQAHKAWMLGPFDIEAKGRVRADAVPRSRHGLEPRHQLRAADAGRRPRPLAAHRARHRRRGPLRLVAVVDARAARRRCRSGSSSAARSPTSSTGSSTARSPISSCSTSAASNGTCSTSPTSGSWPARSAWCSPGRPSAPKSPRKRENRGGMAGVAGRGPRWSRARIVHAIRLRIRRDLEA